MYGLIRLLSSLALLLLLASPGYAGPTANPFAFPPHNQLCPGVEESDGSDSAVCPEKIVFPTDTINISNNVVTYTPAAAGPHALDSSSHSDVTAITEAQGQIIYYDGSNWNALSPGTSGQFLKTQGAGANPVWAAVSGTGTMTTVKEATVQVGGADIVTLDFGAGFDLSESPDTEINITLDFTEVAGHDNFTDFVANEHIDHTSVTLTAGAGLSGGGDISANRSFATASGEADFLASGALTCGAGTQGKVQVHTTPMQYCDNAATPALQYAAYAASDGDALAGDSATSFFDAGTIEEARLPDASTTAQGVAELATAAEIDAGTDTGRVFSPNEFVDSDHGKRTAFIVILDDTEDTAVADGTGDFEWVAPTIFAGWDIVNVECGVYVAGTTNSTKVSLFNVTANADVTSTECEVETGELHSKDAAQQPVIDTGEDDITDGDRYRFDVNAISTTAAKGLWMELTLKSP